MASDSFYQSLTNIPDESLDTDAFGSFASLESDPVPVLRNAELWTRLLALCPPEHHEMLQLKREGHSLEEIAQRTSLHPDSIRWLIRALARELAIQLHPVPEPATEV